jgi:hypothetical protein
MNIKYELGKFVSYYGTLLKAEARKFSKSEFGNLRKNCYNFKFILGTCGANLRQRIVAGIIGRLQLSQLSLQTKTLRFRNSNYS